MEDESHFATADGSTEFGKAALFEAIGRPKRPKNKMMNIKNAIVLDLPILFTYHRYFVIVKIYPFYIKISFKSFDPFYRLLTY